MKKKASSIVVADTDPEDDQKQEKAPVGKRKRVLPTAKQTPVIENTSDQSDEEYEEKRLTTKSKPNKQQTPIASSSKSKKTPRKLKQQNDNDSDENDENNHQHVISDLSEIKPDKPKSTILLYFEYIIYAIKILLSQMMK